MFFKPAFYEKGEKVTIADGFSREGGSGYVLDLLDRLETDDQGIAKLEIRDTLPDFFPLDDHDEGYALEITFDKITLFGTTQRARIYAAETLLQMQDHEGIFTGRLCDSPDCEFRGYRVYLPSRKGWQDFCSMVDTIVYYKYNAISIEVGGAMEYRRHPKINETWKAFAEETHRYSGRASEIQNANPWSKNSIHTDNAEGDILTQDEVRQVVEYCRYRGLEVYPEVPTMSHCDYICLAYPQIAERAEDPYPDTYCPNHPDTYKIVFDILEEVIDVFHPKYVNIGHDELYTVCRCPRCRGKRPEELYAQDIRKIHDWLAQRGITTMMWGEKLLPVITPEGNHFGGAGTHDDYDDQGNLIFEGHPNLYYCQNLLPRDIIMMHWYNIFGIQYDYVYHTHGYKAYYGNMSAPSINNWRQRHNLGIHGGSCSNWGSNDPVYMQRNNQYYNLVFGAYALWSREYDNDIYAQISKATYEECFRMKFGKPCRRPYISVTHTTDKFIPFKVFYDGVFVEEDIYHLGHYRLTYTDGTGVDFPVTYGENISSSSLDCDFADPDASGFNDVSLDLTPLREVSCSTVPTPMEGKTWYQTLFLNPHPDKEIAAFVYVPDTADQVDVRSASYQGKPL